jgi:hypothetical protein
MTTETKAPPFSLTLRERTVLQRLPEALEALIVWHEERATIAEGMELADEVAFHDERAAAIQAEVGRLESLEDASADHERMEGR